MFGKHTAGKHLRSVLLWGSSVASDGDIVKVQRDGKSQCYQYQAPFSKNSLPQKIACTEKEARFVISDIPDETQDTTHCLFGAPGLYIYERIPDGVDQSLLPLRFGLSNEEQHLLYSSAKKALEVSVCGEKKVSLETVNHLVPERFKFKTSVGVALWKDGQIRGSQVVQNAPLIQGVLTAASNASHDKRFKPITEHEVGMIAIEITLIHEPFINCQLLPDTILHEMGYMYFDGEFTGYFLPEVFNVRSFSSKGDFYEKLVTQKAGRKYIQKSNESIYAARVEDFINTNDKLTALLGPVPNLSLSENLFNDECFKAVENAVSWVRSIQDTDGFLPGTISVQGHTTAQLELSRVLFTLYAIAEWQTITNSPELKDVCIKGARYYEKILNDDNKEGTLPLVYLGHLLCTIGESEKAEQIVADTDFSQLFQVEGPIAFTQMLSLIDRVFSEISSESHDSYKEQLLDIVSSVITKAETELPRWAESAVSLGTFAPEKAYALREWLTKHQRPDGSFPLSAVNQFTYSRNVGKIAEILSADPAFKEATKRSLIWLMGMQYTEHSMFHIPSNVRSVLAGSLRHDYENRDAWIDAAGHFILASKRYFAGLAEEERSV